MVITGIDVLAEDLVELLTKTFPDIHGIKVVDEDKIFLGDSAEGGEIDGIPACDYYSEFYNIYPMSGVHRELQKVLEDNGWYAEPFDPGTYHAYRN